MSIPPYWIVAIKCAASLKIQWDFLFCKLLRKRTLTKWPNRDRFYLLIWWVTSQQSIFFTTNNVFVREFKICLFSDRYHGVRHLFSCADTMQKLFFFFLCSSFCFSFYFSQIILFCGSAVLCGANNQILSWTKNKSTDWHGTLSPLSQDFFPPLF